MLESDPLAEYVRQQVQRAVGDDLAATVDTLSELVYRVIRLEVALEHVAPGLLTGTADIEATRRLLSKVGLRRLDDFLKGPNDEQSTE